MSSATPSSAEPKSSPVNGAPAPMPTVLLVVGHEVHRERLRAELGAIAPNAQVEVARSAFDALLRSARPSPVDLLILDMAMDGAAAPALVRHLGRIGQATEVRVFGESGRLQPGEACDIWAWGESGAVLRRWFDERAAGLAHKELDREGT